MSTSKDPAVIAEGLMKQFKIPLEASSGIKQRLINTLKGRKGYREFRPLKEISFTVNKGDFFGIVGRNGSGKSTLLKTIAGIYSPDGGHVVVNGKLVPFIELGVGFNPELTGRENVFLNGALLGFSRRDMEEMYGEIVDFAELHEFMEERLKNYSSGMQVRLAFSIAIRAQSDILLLDEVLAVGDEAFQRKCYEYFEDLKRKKQTVILVTHDMGAVERFCNRAILIESGRIIQEGDPSTVAHAYTQLFVAEDPVQEAEPEQEGPQEDPSRTGDRRFRMKNVTVEQQDAKKYGSDIRISMDVICNEPVNGKILAAYAIKDSMGQKLFGNKIISKKLSELKKGDVAHIAFIFPNLLNRGRYFIDLSVYSDKDKSFCDCWLDCKTFKTGTLGVNGYPVIVKDRYIEH